MADSGVSWNRSSGIVSVDPNEKLFLFGYSCKIFRDDEKAIYIDQGKHLIPWMGDKSHMIDRYDVRGYLHDLKLYEPKSEAYEDPLAEEEKMCDEERYRSLRSDMSEEQLYQEEELKRLRAAIAGDGAYHEIAFTYDNSEADQYVEPEAPKVEEPEDELYQAPEGLTVPKGMEVPYTMKIHAIIEKTALFVSEQGGQMEIIIKMKQQGNPQFAFMHLDNPLYPYYKHLVKVIKSGAYKPVPAKKVSRSEDEDDDGHYLHPSLMSGRQEPVPKFTVPTINFRRRDDDSYSVLVRNLQQHRKEETASPQPESEQNSNEGSENISPASDEENNELKNTAIASAQQIVPPPPDTQPIIDKMAEYVAKNGEDFETIVKSKKDKRFDFLHPWHEYHNYYIHNRNLIKAKMQAESSSSSENAVNDNGTQSVPYQYQPKPVVQESGPVLYKNGQPANKHPKQSTKPSKPVNVATVPAKAEYDALYSQDSQDAVFEPHSRFLEGPKDDTSNSMDFLDSPKIDKISEEEPKSKPPKVLKGPISFSLKSKETDTPSEKAKLTPLLMDDSEDESSEENKTEKDVSTKRRKSLDDSHPASTKTNSVDVEVKAPKQSSEVLEAKQAEERIKDKLLSAARERLAQQRKEKQMLLEQQKREEQLKKDKQQLLDQQRKEKQLQLERKRKAELFLKMLKKKNPDSSAVVSHILASDKGSSGPKPSDFWSLPDTSTIGPPTDGGILFHGNKMYTGLPALKSEWSSDSVSEHSGEEEPISIIGEKLSSEEPEAPEEAAVPKTEKKKKKRKHSSRSRSRDRSRSKRSKTPRRSREKRRSRSRSRKQEKKKEKQLPAAYALSTRSRSRSKVARL
ncbi:Splicing factor, suppressor of white-apricot [Araneus ventricosus]|uniref:Splicing factor, suppressor of white-apricot n=1 Tax=Araneus ventricosus TaxID=182803 RepID=A0A4Y2HQT9_ARAVE|nr:Splicing factor, suppressor of white-apricot [Araneus ventricosus]